VKKQGGCEKKGAFIGWKGTEVEVPFDVLSTKDQDTRGGKTTPRPVEKGKEKNKRPKGKEGTGVGKKGGGKAGKGMEPVLKIK